MRAWVDGAWVEGAAVRLAGDRGLLLGDGLFETVLVLGARVIELDAHLDRLERSGDELGLPPWTGGRETLLRGIDELLARSSAAGRGALRITWTSGSGRGLDRPATGRLLLSLSELPDAPPETLAGVVVDRPRIDPTHPLAGHKSLSAQSWVIARREARRRGADVALVRTTDGDLAEADAANLFVAHDDLLVTPGLDRGVLPGVLRARVLALAPSLGLRVVEERLTEASVATATSVLLSSSLVGLVPLRELDGRRPGPPVGAVADLVRRLRGEVGCM